MEGGGFVRRTVDDVFKDYKARRAGLIKALTTDVEEFYQQCDPDKGNLCLYGFPNETWEVNLPAVEVPPDLPEPALGINFARDWMQEKDWLSLVAVHSDSWLLAVSLYFGARFGFDKNDRKWLLNMMNELPTIYEVFTETAKKQVKERSTVTNNSSSKNKSGGKDEEDDEEDEEDDEEEDEEDDEEEDEEDDKALCGACGGVYSSTTTEFWIACDMCENWFHGKCVNITPARAEHIKKYECPSCSNERDEEEDEEDDEEEDEEDDEEEDEEDDEALCGACGGVYSSTTTEFWIACDMCENWFHGKCVKITPARAVHIKKYECPSCSNKRDRV